MHIELVSPDQHRFSCYVATPEVAPVAAVAAVLVIQEIFGVNEHIRAVCDRYAAAGYLALAPALFDRVRPGVELGYGPDDREKAVELAFKALKMEQAMLDIQTAIDHLAASHKVGVVGYCFGGLLAWLAACELNHVSAVSSYYGGGIIRYKACQPHCPVQLHFGKLDKLIPISDVEVIRELHPQVGVFLYEAGHGFNCDKRDSYQPDAAKLALQRSLELFETCLK